MARLSYLEDDGSKMCSELVCFLSLQYGLHDAEFRNLIFWISWLSEGELIHLSQEALLRMGC